MPGLFEDVAEAAPGGAVDIFGDVPSGGMFDDVPDTAPAGTLGGIGRSAVKAAKATAQAFDVRELGTQIEKIRETLSGAADWPAPPSPRAGYTLNARGAMVPGEPVAARRALPLKDAITQHPRVQALAKEIAGRELELASMRGSAASEAWDQSTGWGAVQTFVRDPVEITANIVAKGLGGSLPGIVSGMVLGTAGGPAGMAVGTGGGSFAVEYANTILEGLRSSGVDLTDPEGVIQGLSDPEKLREWRAHAVKRGVPVGLFDAVSGAVAGKFLNAVHGSEFGVQGAKALIKAGAKEAGMQAGLGAAGELAGQLVSGETLRLKDIFEEAVGELGPGAVETAVNVARSRFLSRPKAKARGVFGDVPESKEREIEAAKGELEKAAAEFNTEGTENTEGSTEAPGGAATLPSGAEARVAPAAGLGVQDPSGGIAGRPLPNSVSALRNLKKEVEARLDEITAHWQEANKGTPFEGQAPFEAVKQTQDLLTEINTKIATAPAEANSAGGTPAEPAAETAALQPWEQTREEYAAGSPFAATQLSRGREHARLVEEALRRGEPVPEHVREEYPEVVQRINAEAERSKAAEAEQTAAAEKAAKRKSGRAFSLAPREDGIPDVLDAIQELGGIAGPSQSRFAKEGDYDGYEDAFGYGAARVLRRTAGGLRPDELRDSLANFGFRFESTSQMYEAVQRASDSRGKSTTENTEATEKQLERMYAAAVEHLERMKVDIEPGDLHAFGIAPAVWNTLVDLVIAGVKAGKTVAEAVQWAIGQARKRWGGDMSIISDEELAAELIERAEVAAGQLPEVIDKRQGEAYQGSSEVSAAQPKPQAGVEGDRKPAAAAKAGGSQREPRYQIPEGVESRGRGGVSLSKPSQLMLAIEAGEPFPTVDPKSQAQATVLEDLVDRVKALELERDRELQLAHMYAGEDPQRAFPTGISAMNRVRYLDGQIDELRRLHQFLKESGMDARIEAAKREVKEKWNDYYGHVGGRLFLGPDPEAIIKAFGYYKALAKLAGLYAAKGVQDAATFAKAIGVKLNAVVTAAWEDAISGTIKRRGEELDPAAVAELSNEMRERKFAKRFTEDERIKAGIRHATQNREYIALPNKLTMAEALAAIEELGIDGARAELTNERNSWDPRVRVTIGQALLHKLNAEYRKTKSEGALGKSVDIAEWLSEFGTRLGQGVQAFAIWARMTPEGYVAMYKRAINRAKKAAEKKAAKAARSASGATTEAAAKKLKLPEYDEKIAGEVLRRASAALEKPEGFQRDEAIVDVLAFIAKQKGISKWDVGIALWYANILSGWTTQVRNLAGNLGNLLAEGFAHAAAYPARLPDILAGIYLGAGRGVLDAANVLRTGKLTGTRLMKMEAPRVLELVRFKGGAWNPLNAWKHVFRVMAAADMVFFRSAEELRARMLARTLAREENLRGVALSRRMAEILWNTRELRAAATAQATAEGLRGINLRRRVNEIVEQRRPASLVEAAAEYGRFATFNQAPTGVLGVIARGIADMSRQWAPLRLVVPFTHIVANVTNAALNFTPWGYRRLFPSAFMGENWMGPEASPMDYRLQAARATLGTVGLTAVWALALGMKDDDDPWFAITAEGPVDPGQRNQLRETGWRPYSVKVGGRWVSYKETPLHLGLALIGNMMDAVKYRKLEDADLWNRVYYAIAQTKNTLLSQSFLSGLADFFDSGNKNVPRGSVQFGGLARTASSVLIPNLVKQVDRLFDPTVYDASTIEGALMRDIPVARRGLEPLLNVLGEPVKADVNPFLGARKEDELWHLLASKQAWITVPSKTMLVHDRMITPEEYAALLQTSGPQIRKRIEANAPMIRALPAENAQDLVDKIVREERAAAKRKLGLR